MATRSRSTPARTSTRSACRRAPADSESGAPSGAPFLWAWHDRVHGFRLRRGGVGAVSHAARPAPHRAGRARSSRRTSRPSAAPRAPAREARRVAGLPLASAAGARRIRCHAGARCARAPRGAGAATGLCARWQQLDRADPRLGRRCQRLVHELATRAHAVARSGRLPAHPARRVARARAVVAGLREDFAILDGLRRHDPVARRRPAVALGTRTQGRPAVRRGARAGGRQQADHRRGVAPGQARHRHRALGALRVDHRAPPAPARAPGSRRSRRRGPSTCDGDALAAKAWWRTEHQTFIPVEGHQQAVFTIHVEVQPLARACALSPTRHAPGAGARRTGLDERGRARLPRGSHARCADRPACAWAMRGAGHAGPAESTERPLQPARIDFSDASAPRAIDFDDVYHPRGGAFEQARHVFLGGNGLPQRWSRTRPLRGAGDRFRPRPQLSRPPGPHGATTRALRPLVVSVGRQTPATARRPAPRACTQRRARPWRAS